MGYTTNENLFIRGTVFDKGKEPLIIVLKSRFGLAVSR